MKKDLKECLVDLYSDNYTMAQFAFELRVFDSKNSKQTNRPDYYTNKFISYNVFTNPIWQAILTSNHWYEEPNPPGELAPRMIVDPNV